MRHEWFGALGALGQLWQGHCAIVSAALALAAMRWLAFRNSHKLFFIQNFSLFNSDQADAFSV